MIKDIPGMLTYIFKEIQNAVDIAVIGMSGGADSSLVATLCRIALGPENVHTLHMPYGQGDWDRFNSRSWSLAGKLGVKRTEMPVHEIADAISYQLGRLGPVSRLNAGNARARARMALLYGTSATLAERNSGMRVRVMGTGNLSEDYLGYDTKGGDALADLFIIGDLYKSEVYQLLEYFRDQGILDEEHIDRVPSAGLWDGQTDEGELGYSYNEMQPVVEYFRSGGTMQEAIEICARYSPEGVDLYHKVYTMHAQNRHKHEAPPVLLLRQFCTGGI